MIGMVDSILEIIARVYMAIAKVLLALLVVGIFSEVIMRYFLGTGYVGSSELANLAIVWIVFMVAAVLHRRRRHIVITALIDGLNPRGKWAAAVLVDIGTVILAAYIFYQFYNVYTFLRLNSPVFHIPDLAFKTAPLFAFAPIALQSIINLVTGEPDSNVAHSVDDMI